MLTPRLVRKNYRAFRVYVVRENGQTTRSLSLPEASRVWLWIAAPEVAFYLLASLLIARLSPETASAISSLALWIRFLLIGPFGVGIAVRAKYYGFRLEASGYNYI